MGEFTHESWVVWGMSILKLTDCAPLSPDTMQIFYLELRGVIREWLDDAPPEMDDFLTVLAAECLNEAYADEREIGQFSRVLTEMSTADIMQGVDNERS